MSNETTEADGTLYAILYQIILAVAVVGAFIIGYEILRQSKIGKYIYAPRTILLPDQTPEPANGWFAWLKKNRKVDEDYVLRNNGLDAVMVLKLYRMGYQMFLTIGIFIIVFTLPFNIAFRDRTNNTSVADESSANLLGGDSKSLLQYIFGKRDLQVDVANLNITVEEERNEFFNEEIKILNEIKGKYQVEPEEDKSDTKSNDKSKTNEENEDNAEADGETDPIDETNNNSHNQTDGSRGVDDETDRSSVASEVASFANATITNTITGLKRFDLKKYIFFDTLREGKEMFSLFHLVAVYFVVIYICYRLFKIYQEYLHSVEKYVKDGGIVQERNLFGEILQHSTIMVRNIPPELQDDERLMTWFTKLGIGKIESVVIARSRNKIRRLVEERTKVLNTLEDNYVQWANNIKDKKNGESFVGKLFKNVVTNETDDIGEKVFEDNDAYRPKSVIFKYGVLPVRYVDAIHYNEQRLMELTQQIKELRLEAHDSKKWSQTAFITFNNHQSAKIAAQLILYSSRNPNVMAAGTAPHPNDLLYKNLNIRTEHKTYRSILVYILLYFFCFVLAILVIATKYSTLKHLCEKYFSYLNVNKVFDYIDNSPQLSGLFESFFQVILLSIYTTCIPYILKFLSNFQGFETKSAYANSVLKKYYIFLVITIIFSMSISTLADSIIDPNNEEVKIDEVSNITKKMSDKLFNINFTEFVKDLTSELSKNTVTYFNYGIIRLQSFGFEIFRIGAVCFYFIGKLLKKDSPRAKHLANQMAAPPDYSIMLGVPLLCFTLFITFSVVNPFISLIGFVFFYVGYNIMKNQFLFVYVKDFDSQGHFFVTCFNRIIFSLFLFELFMFGYFLAICKTGKSKFIPYLILPTLLITIYFYKYCRKCFKPRIDNVPVDLLISKERKEKYSNQYQRRTIFGRRESFVSDYFSEDSFISCATHITSLDSKPNKEILKMAESQAPSLPPYYEAKSYNNPALTESLYAPWISEEAQSLFTDATINNIVNISKECYRCDKESRFE